MTPQNSSVDLSLRDIAPSGKAQRNGRAVFMPSLLSLGLMLALFLPFNLLFVPFLFLIFHTAKSGAKGIHYLAFGLMLFSFYLLIGNGEIRTLLPFVILFGLSNPVRTERTTTELNLTFYVFVFITLAVAMNKLGGWVDLESLLKYYDSGEAEQFEYTIEDLGNFRAGSIYFNPNQWASLACVFMIFLRVAGELSPAKIVCMFAITLATASRMTTLILVAVLFFDQLGKWTPRKSLVSIIVLALFVFYVLSVQSRLTNYSAATLFDQAFFKFTLLGQLSRQESLFEFVFGNGSIGKGVFHFDADLGNILKTFGLLGGSSIIFLYYAKLKERFSLFSILLLSLMSAYTTVLMNTRVAIVFAILAMMCLAERKIANSPV